MKENKQDTHTHLTHKSNKQTKTKKIQKLSRNETQQYFTVNI